MSTLLSWPPLIPMVTLLTMVSHVTNTPEAAPEMEITVGEAGSRGRGRRTPHVSSSTRPHHASRSSRVVFHRVSRISLPKSITLGFLQHHMASWPFWPNFSSTWAAPLCPYLTTGWVDSRPPSFQPGVLGPRPQQNWQAHIAHGPGQSSSYASTDISDAIHTSSLTPPREQWYMDTGVT